jgi:putative colanic acid biosynthesis glycosyltransferase
MRFSIITVTYNNLRGLNATRESVRAQTCKDFEWIVMDGGSTDGTQDAMQAWQHEIAAAVSERDKGPYDAMNKGLALARGEYVLFINAGDALAGPDVLAQLDAAIALNAADFVFGDSLEEQIDGKTYYKKSRRPIFRWWGMFTHHQAMAYRREFLNTLLPAYDLRYKVGADLDLTWRIFKKTKRVLQVDFAIARCERAGISTAQASGAREEQLLMRHEHAKCFALLNVGIMLAQSAVWALRQRAPGLYKAFRLRRNSAISS